MSIHHGYGCLCINLPLLLEAFMGELMNELR